MLPINRQATRGKLAFSIFMLIFAFLLANQAAVAQQNGISSPSSGEVISGVVEVMGTAVHPDYLRYELAFLYEASSSAGWIVFAEGSQPVQSGILAVWDTTVGRDIGAPVFPDGRYQLRLRIVKTDYNYDEYFVTDLTIFNSGPTPVPSPEETALALTATAQVNQPDPQATVGSDSFQQLTPLPSLTPFPTPTSLPTAVGSSQTEAGATDQSDGRGGLVGQLESVDVTLFSKAFWSGVRITMALFVLLAFYLVLRRLGRYLWRLYWANKS